MKIRILSDLHLDINQKIPFLLEDKEIFTVLCGDISGNPEQTIEWINQNIKQGVFVEGNHIGYDSQHSIQYIENLLSAEYFSNFFEKLNKLIKFNEGELEKAQSLKKGLLQQMFI